MPRATVFPATDANFEEVATTNTYRRIERVPSLRDVNANVYPMIRTSLAHPESTVDREGPTEQEFSAERTGQV